ncbi:MAG: hypothetical protein GF329_21925 [Candidatus Lokiarchaeota archaeon]|nr:hypothetical protein [Candidatus Lokiarchaeota archaeon]
MAYGLLTGAIPPTQILIDKIYSCFYCGICQANCPSGVITSDLVLRTRRELMRLGVAPENIRNLCELIIESKNIYGLDQEDRLEWAFEVDELIKDKISKKSDIGYFVGCTAAYKGSLAIQPESIVKILDTLDIDFTLIAENEMCCGNPYFLAGGDINEEFKEIIFNNIEQFADLKIKKLITACPGCYRVINTIYPIIYGKELPFKIFHISQFFSDLMNKGILNFRNPINMNLTFQDPCELSRHCEDYESPRKVIEKLPKLGFNELIPNREEALCCGGGGLVKALFPELVDKHLERKFNQIQECDNNIDGIITTCPSCQDNLEHGCSVYNKDLKVFSLSELVWEAIKD